MKLSVIIPAYNVSPYIEECIDSVLNEGYANLEVIVVDDGSTDNTSQLIDRYATDTRVKIIHKANGGANDARQHGLNVASGQWVTFVDGDDAIEVGSYIKAMYFFAEHPEVDILSYPILFDWGNERSKKISGNGRIISSQKDIFTNLLTEKITFSSCDKIFKRDLFDGIALPVDVLYDDMYFIPQVLNRAQNIYLSQDGCYMYRYRETSQTRSSVTAKQVYDWIGSYIDIAVIVRRAGVSYSERSNAAFKIISYLHSRCVNFSLNDKQNIFEQLRRVNLISLGDVIKSTITFNISLRKNIILAHYVLGNFDHIITALTNREKSK